MLLLSSGKFLLDKITTSCGFGDFVLVIISYEVDISLLLLEDFLFFNYLLQMNLVIQYICLLRHNLKFCCYRQVNSCWINNFLMCIWCFRTCILLIWSLEIWPSLELCLEKFLIVIIIVWTTFVLKIFFITTLWSVILDWLY